MDVLYRSLVKRLTDTVGAEQTLWIDLEAGQLEAIDENYPVTFPAVFIDLAECQFKTLGRGLQEGYLNIGIRIAFDVYNDFHGTAPDIETACANLKLINQVHAALHGFGGMTLQLEDESYEDNHFSRLQRTGLTTEKRADGLKIFTMTYTTTIRDAYAMPNYITYQVEVINVTKEDGN
jgi:hypothetical protein